MTALRRCTVVLVTAVALVSACGGGGTAESSGPPDGAAIFARNCAACHSVDGSGGVGSTLLGVHERLDDAEIAAVIIEGRNGMPAWRGRLDDAEVQAVVDHLRLLDAS